ncbi:sensor domain-containing diguanylate cyclase [Devosia rhizoryzae]|uniref:diguanylate cyclase n=1 Tax=Devosia rhizoryzae TaxID=2774137 RepID=A0ABX7C444_9HYPH|nr:sensor domain-containing diguanylate cyclase [Devosia rhizoryzae]QQR38963.1 sensor domain-containing diguanylate cyclase [Devosia rhizoryzae]
MSAVLEKPSPVSPIADEARLEAVARYDVLDTPREPAFDRVASLIRLIFGVETSVVSLIDGHRQWFKAAEGNKVDELPIKDTFCRHALIASAPLIVPDATKDERFRNNPLVTGEVGVRFYAGVPITTYDGFNIGTVCAIDSHPREFSEREEKILYELAQIVTNELELRRLATTDGLTGISTRRAFKEDAQKFVALARRHRSQLSAIAFDINHFKKVNDTYGHAAGDVVLKAVAETVGGVLRQSDVLGRLGGEEFAVILPDADAASAMAVAEKLRHSLLTLRFPGSKPPMTISASFGVATLDPGADDLDALLVKADEALYEAKGAGRNVSMLWRGATTATTRHIDRRRVLKAGRLVFNDKKSVIDCTVRALWDGGAEVQVFNSADIPDAVTLEIRSSGFKWDATVVSRRPTSLELSFRAA